MAPSFLSDFRRRSKASFRTDESAETTSNANSHSNTSSNGHGNSNGNGKGNSYAHSSSSVNLPFGTPPPVMSTSTSATNLHTMGNANGNANGNPNGNGTPGLPFRPAAAPSLTSRQSVSGMSGLGAPNTTLPTSQYAPRILSIADNAWVTIPQPLDPAWLVADL